MSEAITEQRWKELTACFQALDANHDGRIDKQELDQTGFDKKPAYKKLKKDVEMMILSHRK